MPHRQRAVRESVFLCLLNCIHHKSLSNHRNRRSDRMYVIPSIDRVHERSKMLASACFFKFEII